MTIYLRFRAHILNGFLKIRLPIRLISALTVALPIGPMIAPKIGLIIGLTIGLTSACGKIKSADQIEGSSSDSNIGASVVSSVGSAAEETETPVSILNASNADVQSTLEATPAAQTCKIADARQACSGDTLKVRFSKCKTVNGDSSLDGEWSSQYSPAAACDSHQQTKKMPAGASILKTTKAFTVHGRDSDLIISSVGISAASGPISGGVAVSRVRDGGELYTDVMVNGLNKKTLSRNLEPRSNLLLYSKLTSVRVTGSKLLGNRLANGTISVQDNLNKKYLEVTMLDVMWADPLCCYPTSGKAKIDTPNPNAPKDKISLPTYLVFNTKTCGTAYFLGANGKGHSVPLSMCEE